MQKQYVLSEEEYIEYQNFKDFTSDADMEVYKRCKNNVEERRKFYERNYNQVLENNHVEYDFLLMKWCLGEVDERPNRYAFLNKITQKE